MLATHNTLIMQLEKLCICTLMEEEEECCREEQVMHLAKGMFLALGGPQHTLQSLYSPMSGGGSAIRGKGKGGAGTEHYVLLTDPHMKHVIVKLYVYLLRCVGHSEDKLMEWHQRRVRCYCHTCHHHHRRLSMCVCSMGL